MESEEMVLMNLQQFTRPCVKEIASGDLLYDLGTQTGSATGWRVECRGR